MSGATSLPIRITVDGVQQADAAFNAVTASGTRAQQQLKSAADNSASSFGKFNQVLGQGGYQLQDFAVQVQGGTSALTALSQQGSQFLGLFGTGGAVAGAILTVGILAYKFIEGDDAAKKLNDTLKATDEYFERLEKSSSGLTASIETQVKTLKDLRQQYANLSATQQEYERRELDRRQRANDEAAAALRGAARDAVGNRAADFVQRTATMDAARANLGQAPLGVPDDVRDLAGVLTRLRTSESLDPDAIAGFGTQLERLAAGGGKAAREAKSALEALEKLLPQARTLAESNQRLGLARTALTGGDSLLDTIPPEEPSDGPPDPPRARKGRADPADKADVEGMLEKLRLKQDETAKSLAASLDPTIAAWQKYQETLENVQKATDLYAATIDRAGGPLGLSPQQAEHLGKLAKDQYDSTMKKIGEQGEAAGLKMESAFGRATSALEQAIVAGGSLSDVVKGLETDLSRLIIRLTVMNPLEKAGNSLLTSLGSAVGKALGSAFGGAGVAIPDTTGQTNSRGETIIFEHANGGIFGPGGPVPLRPYATGGIANSPQLALFGEGRTPEAYVPLPDGRTIPVTMQGAGGSGVVYSPTYTVDARGADAGVEQRLVRVMQQMIAADRAKFVDTVQRGGSLSKTMGRR
jgi:hypothetical protein